MNAPAFTGGYVLLYRQGMICPGCGGASWIVRSGTAECGACATALPITSGQRAPDDAAIATGQRS